MRVSSWMSVVLMALIGVAANASSAHAWLKICNNTNKTVQYTHSFSASCGPRDMGWWIMNPSECKTVYGDGVSNKFFQFYAEATDGSLQWTSGSLGWRVPNYAHDNCNLRCTGCPNERLLFHREFRATATNFTLNLTL